MRHMTEVEIDAKLAEIDKKFSSVRDQVAEMERQIVVGREEMLRIQGDYRTWASLKEHDKKIDETPATEAASV